MRVLHVLSSNQRRGAEVFACQLAERLDGHGLENVVRAIRTSSSTGRLPIEVLGRSRLDPKAMLRLRRLMTSADVVVAHGSITLPAVACAGIGITTPFVYRGIGDPSYWTATRMRRLRVATYLRRAAMVTAMYADAATQLVERLSVPAERVVVVPVGVPASEFPPATPSIGSAARARLGVPPDRPVFAVVGALRAEKRVDVAIDAMAYLKTSHLVIAGDGPERVSLESLAQRRAPGRVVFLGETTEPQVVMHAADVLLVPSGTEGLPAVVIEAAFAGVPSVATAVGGLPELIADTGFIVPPGDPAAMAAAAERLLLRRDELARRARARCLERYELDQVVTAWLSVLQSAVAL